MSSSRVPLRFLLLPSNGEVREHVHAEFFGKLLAERINRPVEMEIAHTYEQVARDLTEGRVDLAWTTAGQQAQFGPRARAVLHAVRAGRWSYHAALIRRADAPLRLELLHGARAAWVAPHSTGGYLLAMRHLRAQGQVPEQIFSRQQFHGSYRHALMAVLRGEADVTSIYVPHPNEPSARAGLAERLGAEEHRLTPFAFTEACLADGILITSRLTEQEATTLVSVLTGLGQEGRPLELLQRLYGIEGFVLANTSSAHPRPLKPTPCAEYLAVELDAQQRCRHLLASTGGALQGEPRAVPGQPLSQVLSTEVGASLESFVRAAQYSGVGGRMELRMSAGGERRLYAAEVTLRATAPEQAAREAMLLVRDVTGEHALERELYQLASIPQMHPEPMLEMEEEGPVLYANPAARTAFPDLMWRGVSHPLVEAALARTWRRGSSQSPVVLRLASRSWELVVSHLREANVIRVFAKDVTERLRMEATLLHADRMAALGSLAARVGHQMNNPLAFLLANLTFVREELVRLQQLMPGVRDWAATQELREVLDALSEAQEGAERLKVIVQDLRLLERAPPAHPTRVNLLGVLEDCLKLVRNELRHRARLEKDFKPIPRVAADEARLAQVVLNLLLNAVQAMSDKDAVSNVLFVSTRWVDISQVEVVVQDTGAGMTPEVLAHVFEPFFTTRPNNLGMGLSVSHAIVTGLGGTLRAESQVGVGTRFILRLPAAEAQPALPVPPHATPAPLLPEVPVPGFPAEQRGRGTLAARE